MLLRCNVSSIAASRPASGPAMRFSSSVRVSRTSDWKPGRSTGTTVAVSADRRSLACLLSSRSRVSEPTAAVPAGSALLASAMPARTWLSTAWSIWSPEKSAYRTVSPMGARFAAASASVMLVPLPPRSTSATTPARQARRGLQRGERGDRVRVSAPRARRRAPGSACPAGRRAARRSSRVPSARAPRWRRAAPPPTVRAIASRASTSTRSPRWELPSSATSGTGSPTRSTKPVSTMPGWLSAGFSPATPTSGARSANSVSTDAAHHGRRPTRAATRLVIPMDNPRESLMHTPSCSAAHHDSGRRRAEHGRSP